MSQQEWLPVRGFYNT